MLMLAHGGHWLVSLAYFAPVAGFVVWLVIVTVRERWAEAGRDGGEERSGDSERSGGGGP